MTNESTRNEFRHLSVETPTHTERDGLRDYGHLNTQIFSSFLFYTHLSQHTTAVDLEKHA